MKVRSSNLGSSVIQPTSISKSAGGGVNSSTSNNIKYIMYNFLTFIFLVYIIIVIFHIFKEFLLKQCNFIIILYRFNML